MKFFVPIDIARYPTITSPTQSSSQCGLTNAGSQIGSLGFFLLLLMISCFCSKQWHRKRCEQKTSVHQQVEILETNLENERSSKALKSFRARLVKDFNLDDR